MFKNSQQHFLITTVVLLLSTTAFAQKTVEKLKRDSIWRAEHIPKLATKRSAMIPGWGQAYNKEYWKIPLVYGALSIPVFTYIYNDSYYKKTKFAYEARYKAQKGDTSDVAAIDPELKNLSMSSLVNYRNSFRRDKDYAILWFLFAWGLQVADATVFGHLKQFNVNSDLSMQIHPQFNPATKTPALSLSFNWRDQPKKHPNLVR